MLKRLFISSLFICLAICTAQADDKLDTAMKRIAELEAKNKVLEQSNKEKETLLKNYGVKVNRLQPKTSSKSALLSSAPLSLPASSTSRTNDNAQPAIGGVYFGINGGYGGGDINSYNNFIIGNSYYAMGSSIARAGGAMAGGQVGYNYLFHNHAMLGAEADFNWADISTTGGSTSRIAGNGTLGSSGSSSGFGLNWIGTARIRLGYQLQSIMPYITGGMAYGMAVAQSEFNSGSTYLNYYTMQWHYANLSKISVGWSAGAGFEYAINDNWSLKTEYLYSQVGSAPPTLTDFIYGAGQTPSAIVSYGQNSPIGVHQVRAGLNFHPHFFEQPAPSIAAKY